MLGRAVQVRALSGVAEIDHHIDVIAPLDPLESEDLGIASVADDQVSTFHATFECAVVVL